MKSFCTASWAARTPVGRNGVCRNAIISVGARQKVAANNQVRLYSESPTGIQIESLNTAAGTIAETKSSTQAPLEPASPNTNDAGTGLTEAPPQKTPLSFRRISDSHITPDRFRELMRHVSHPVVVISSLYLPPIPKTETSSTKTTTTTAPSNRPGSNKSQTTEEGRPCSSPIPRAMTVSSFTSIRLMPTPYIMFNISLPSNTYEAIASSHRFNVHILADNEEGAWLANRFAQGGSRLDRQTDDNDNGRPTKGVSRSNVRVHGRSTWNSEWDRYVGKTNRMTPYSSWTPLSRNSVPIIQSNGVLYTLRCVVLERMHSNSRLFGLINLGRSTSIIVAEVEDFVHGQGKHSSIPEDGIGLSYALQHYRKTGEAHDLHTQSNGGKELPSNKEKMEPITESIRTEPAEGHTE
ncbi:putative Flavin reductase like domain-containing protein [Seiridium cardinale]